MVNMSADAIGAPVQARPTKVRSRADQDPPGADQGRCPDQDLHNCPSVVGLGALPPHDIAAVVRILALAILRTA